MKLVRNSPAAVAGNLTELLRLFEIIVRELETADGIPCKAVIDAEYTGVGVANFATVAQACQSSDLQGRIECVIEEGTVTNEGSFNGIYVFFIEAINSTGSPASEIVAFPNIDKKNPRALVFQRCI